MCIGGLCSCDNLSLSCFRISEQNIIPNAAAEQKIVLKHHTHLISQAFHCPLTNILPTDDELPFLNIIETWNQTYQRRFATSAHTYKGHSLSRIYLK
ncbi:hypothetical protein D3C80_1673960 [compost metagenome]